MSEVFRWGKVAADEEHKELKRVIFDILHYLSHHPPVEFKRYLPDVIDLMLKTQYCRVLDSKYCECSLNGHS